MKHVDISEENIRITADNAVEITTTYVDGTKAIKNITFQEFMEAVVSSAEVSKEDDYCETPTLTNNDKLGVKTIKHIAFSSGLEIVFIIKKAHRCDITYFNDVYHDVGIPDLVFGITLKDGQFRKASVLAVKDSNAINDQTEMYYYPFSNVSYNGSICFGNNAMIKFDYKELTHLHGFPSMFLSIPNNNDSYGNNNSGLQYRPLLEKLKGHDFPKKYLKKSATTFGQWAKSVGGIK